MSASFITAEFQPRSGAEQVSDRLTPSPNAGQRTRATGLPKFPAPGGLAALNTEYPFQREDGSWRAPAEAGAFEFRTVERFLRLAEHVHIGAAKVRSAIKRTYP